MGLIFKRGNYWIDMDSGSNFGYSPGSGFGCGYGYGSSSGSGYGKSYGYGAGYGSGDSYGSGYSSGSGSGYGSGYGDCYGFGYGDCYGVNCNNGKGWSSLNGYGASAESGFGWGSGDFFLRGEKMWWIEIETNNNLLKKHYFEEENAEIRAKIIEKIGLEPIIADCNPTLLDEKTLEIGGEYELYQIGIHEEKRVFLKMVNPSTKIFHAEWVKPSIRTIEDALLWRNYGALPKSIT